MCNDVFRRRSNWMFQFVPDKFKTQGMCEFYVKEDARFVKFVPDWFVTAKMVEKCPDEK